jgi:hypothetical protein
MSSLLDPIFDTAGDGMAPDTLFADETENRGTDDAAATSEDDSADEYQGEPMTSRPDRADPAGRQTARGAEGVEGLPRD